MAAPTLYGDSKKALQPDDPTADPLATPQAGGYQDFNGNLPKANYGPYQNDWSPRNPDGTLADITLGSTDPNAPPPQQPPQQAAPAAPAPTGDYLRSLIAGGMD